MANVAKFEKEREALELACKMAADTQIVANAASFFMASEIVQTIDQALTPEVIEKVAMPLMNRRCGFLTDKREGGYPADVVRDAMIDAITIGLLPVGNQFNIIAGKMYPTKEGYTALLDKLGVKYLPYIGSPKCEEQGYYKFPCEMKYYYKSEAKPVMKNFKIEVSVPVKNGSQSIDMLSGKAERRFKKRFHEFLTGLDYGDADEESGQTIISPAPDSVKPTDENKAKAAAVFGMKAKAEDLQPEGENNTPQRPLTEEERKAAFQAELAKSKANMGIK